MINFNLVTISQVVRDWFDKNLTTNFQIIWFLTVSFLSSIKLVYSLKRFSKNNRIIQVGVHFVR